MWFEDYEIMSEILPRPMRKTPLGEVTPIIIWSLASTALRPCPRSGRRGAFRESVGHLNKKRSLR